MDAEGRQNVKFFGGLLLAGGAVYLLFQKIGLIKTAEEKAQIENANKLTAGAAGDASKLDPKNPALSLNPKYWIAILAKWKKDNKKNLLTIKELDIFFNPLPGNGKSYNVNLAAMADTIVNSKKTWWLPDTEDDTFGIFRSLKSQAQVSKLSDVFLTYIKTDMLAFIKTFFSDAQLSELYQIVSNKPLM